MKRFLTVLLAMAFVMSFASCSKDEGDATDQSEVTTENMGTKETPDTDSSFEQGSVAQQTYKNEFIGIGCTLDDGWTFYTDDQIAKLNEGKSDILYDMYAENSASAQKAEVKLQKLTRVQVLSLDLETMYNSQSAMIKADMEKEGAVDFSYTIETVSLAGKDTPALVATATVNGDEVHRIFASLKAGEYLTNITVTADSKDAVDLILGTFFSLGVNN